MNAERSTPNPSLPSLPMQRSGLSWRGSLRPSWVRSCQGHSAQSLLPFQGLRPPPWQCRQRWCIFRWQHWSAARLLLNSLEPTEATGDYPGEHCWMGCMPEVDAAARNKACLRSCLWFIQGTSLKYLSHHGSHVLNMCQVDQLDSCNMSWKIVKAFTECWPKTQSAMERLTRRLAKRLSSTCTLKSKVSGNDMPSVKFLRIPGEGIGTGLSLMTLSMNHCSQSCWECKGIKWRITLLKR